MTPAYPLRLQPFFRDYLWGGRKLQSVLGKELPQDGIWAESWEIVDHPEHSSVIANGALAGHSLGEVTQSDASWLLGNSSQVAAIPLLLKYLDCQRVLSVQVHPDDKYAAGMTPPDLGKTEAWYIIAAEPGALLYAGLKAGVARQDLRRSLESGNVEDCLHAIEPQAGDCVFIPAGTVHALGAGLLVAEIQQASNTTFRLFDWNRVDANGQPRALHIDQSLEVIDFESGPRALQVPSSTLQVGRERLVDCDKFVLDRLSGHATAQRQPLAGDGRFHFLTVPEGEAKLYWNGNVELLTRGQSVLLPACMPQTQLELPIGSTLLEMTHGD